MFLKRSLLATLPLTVLCATLAPALSQPEAVYPADPKYAVSPSPSPAPFPQNTSTAPVYPQGVQPQAPMPYQGQPPQVQGGQQPPRTLSVNDWFARYDQTRYRAQMSPAEKNRADTMMSKGLSILIPGEEKQSTKALLISLVNRYQRAQGELKALPMIKPTQELHRGYFQYFATAARLFQDYVAVQDNVFLTDATGQSVAAGLLPRKQGLENLERSVKGLDSQLRQQYNIPPYPY